MSGCTSRSDLRSSRFGDWTHEQLQGLKKSKELQDTLRNEILYSNLAKIESFVECGCAPLFGFPPMIFEEENNRCSHGDNCWMVLLKPIMSLKNK